MVCEGGVMREEMLWEDCMVCEGAVMWEEMLWEDGLTQERLPLMKVSISDGDLSAQYQWV